MKRSKRELRDLNSEQAAIRAALAESIFGGLFSAPQSAKAKEYRRNLEKAMRVVASFHEAEASNKPASKRESDPKWIN